MSELTREQRNVIMTSVDALVTRHPGIDMLAICNAHAKVWRERQVSEGRIEIGCRFIIDYLTGRGW